MKTKHITICRTRFPDGWIDRSRGELLEYKSFPHLTARLVEMGLSMVDLTREKERTKIISFIGGKKEPFDPSIKDQEAFELGVLVLDVDIGVRDGLRETLAKLPYECAGWTTRSDDPKGDRHYRVMVNCNALIKTRDEKALATQTVNDRLGGTAYMGKKSLNALNDIPYPQSEVYWQDGSLLDIVGLRAANFAPEGEAVVESEVEIIETPATAASAEKHFYNLAHKQISSLLTMPVGQDVRNNCCASVGWIIGAAYEGAVQRGATLDEDDVQELLREAIRSRAFAADDEKEYIGVLLRQFRKGRGKPLTMGKGNKEMEKIEFERAYKERYGKPIKVIVGGQNVKPQDIKHADDAQTRERLVRQYNSIVLKRYRNLLKQKR